MRNGDTVSSKRPGRSWNEIQVARPGSLLSPCPLLEDGTEGQSLFFPLGEIWAECWETVNLDISPRKEGRPELYGVAGPL